MRKKTSAREVKCPVCKNHVPEKDCKEVETDDLYILLVCKSCAESH